MDYLKELIGNMVKNYYRMKLFDLIKYKLRILIITNKEKDGTEIN